MAEISKVYKGFILAMVVVSAAMIIALFVSGLATQPSQCIADICVERGIR